MEPVLIVLSTYQRTETALTTVRGAKRLLRYEGELKWYIADDGSQPGHVHRLTAEIGPDLAGMHSERISYGAGMNRAMQFARGLTPLCLWLEDDWELNRTLDLTPYAQLLIEDAKIGMIRLGHWVELEKANVTLDGRLYYDLSPKNTYLFSGNPRLTHARFHDAYGEFPEGERPGETERIFDSYMRFKHPYTVKVVWPAELGEGSVWNHNGYYKSF